MTPCLICGGETAAGFEATDTLHGVPGPFFVRVCNTCGAGVTLPLVEERDLGRFYPGAYYTHAGPTGFAALVAAFYNWRRMVRLGLSGMRPGKILELGPGDCSFLLFLKERGWQVLGIDPDPSVVGNGKRAGLAMIEGTAAQLPDEKFDAIVAWHSLEHSIDPRRDVRILLDRLSPGGKLIVGVPDFGSAWAHAFGPAWHNLDVPRHRVHFTKGAMQRLAAGSGARLERLRVWLSPRAVIESLKVKRKLAIQGSAETALGYALTPVCWALEALGAGDCMSVSLTRDVTPAVRS